MAYNKERALCFVDKLYLSKTNISVLQTLRNILDNLNDMDKRL